MSLRRGAATSPPIAAAVHASTRLDFDAFKLSPAPGAPVRPLIRHCSSSCANAYISVDSSSSSGAQSTTTYERVQFGGFPRLIGRAVRHNVALLILARPCDRFVNAATKLAGVLAPSSPVELRGSKLLRLSR